jgi:crotonobetainyl-CoA:carnitine CoA-transferase CaiB-like acyl-CoA transferase
MPDGEPTTDGPLPGAGPLVHCRVLDVGRSAATAWCSRLLADYGADVVTEESGNGHPLRGLRSSAGRALASHMLANKRSVTDAIGALIASADIIVTDAAFDQSPATLQQINPDAVVVAISPFGLEGQRRAWPANDLTLSAMSGWSSVNGLRGRPPLKPSGAQISYQAGTLAMGCALAALLCRDEFGGQVIDIAALDVAVSTFAPALLRYQYTGTVQSRRQTLDMVDSPVRVKDGWFALTVSRPHFWIKAMEILGLPDLAADPELQNAQTRRRHRQRFLARVQHAMASWSRMDLFDALAGERVIAGPVLTVAELGHNPQFEARRFLTRPRARTGDAASLCPYPGPPFRMSRTPWQLRHGMSAAGGARAEWSGNGLARRHEGEAPATGSRAPIRKPAGPLSGLRGLVLTQAWAGTYTTELLGLLGAEIVQLEATERLDSWRGGRRAPLPAQLSALPSAQHAWNCNPLFNSVNLNKQSITVDLALPDGVDVFKRLVRHADFIVENFSPRVMGQLGIGYDVLADIRPDVILLSMSAYGHTGPWANVPGIGGTIEPSSGMSSLLGYEDGIPQNSGLMYPDPVAGLYGLAAVTAALLHRSRTGEGQFIDLSMQEANFTFIGDAWLQYAVNGEVRAPAGNRHPEHAPHGCYPAAGDDQWVTIGVDDERQWRALAALLNLAPADPRFADPVCRKSHEAELDELVGAWTGLLDKWAITASLVAAGVPAAPVLDAAEVLTDPMLRERGVITNVVHPEAGPAWQAALPARFSVTPGGVRSAAPCLDQHSFAVFHTLLGTTDAEFTALRAAGITGCPAPTEGESL